MRVILIACVLLVAVRASGQELETDENALPVLPDVAATATQEPELRQPETDDPVGRLEGSRDRIEQRLDQEDADREPVEPQALPEPAATDATLWRYRYQDGVWWYWLPSNRWVYWSNGRWVDYVAPTTRTTVLYRSAVPATPYFPSYSYRYPRFSSYSLYDFDYPGLYSFYEFGSPRLYSSYSLGYPRFYSSYGLYPTYRRSFYSGYGGYGGYGNLGSAIGLGLSIGHSLSHHHHHHHGHLHLGHRHFGHHHFGHGHFGHGHFGHGHHHHH